MLKGVNRENFWTVTLVNGSYPNIGLGDAIDGIVDLLALKKDFMTDFIATGGEAELFVGWFFDEGNSGDVLSHGLLARLGELGLSLSFDVYPDVQTAALSRSGS